MTRKDFLSRREHWITKIQVELFHELEEYMKVNNLSRTQLAEKLGVTKGYVSQVLNGDFDHRISKLVDLSLAMGKAPHVEYSNLDEIIAEDTRIQSNAWFAFKDVIRGDQPQHLPYKSNEAVSSANSTIQTA